MTVHGRRAGGAVRATSRREGVFEARAVAYGAVDSYGSVWWPGCLDASLNRRLPICCWAHDWARILGRATSWRSSPEGPIITVRLDVHDDVPDGRMAFAQLLSGTVTDVSVGFSNAKRRDPTAAERQKWPGVKEVILQAQLDELSLVALGAVPKAEVLAVRSSRRAAMPTKAEFDEIDEILRRVNSPWGYRR